MNVPQAPDEEWPEAWLMPESVEDQTLPNRLEPNIPVTAADMRKLGINYWKLDASAYTYPIKSVPWDPKDAVDPKLQALRDDRGKQLTSFVFVALVASDRLYSLLVDVLIVDWFHEKGYNYADIITIHP